MTRRELLGVLGGAAAWPFPVFAQRKPPLIAVLSSGVERDEQIRLSELFQGLRQHGLDPDKDLEFTYRFAFGDLTVLPTLARELIRLKPRILVATVTQAAVAARAASADVPILVPMMIDPVGVGLADSHARPGRNLTGILASIDSLPGKQIELLLELVPTASRIAVLSNPSNAQNATQVKDAFDALRASPKKLNVVEARSVTELDRAFSAIEADALLVLADPLFVANRKQIAVRCLQAKLPSVYTLREHVVEGGLVSYGISRQANFRRAAAFVDKILKGTPASEIPIELPTKFELVVNLRTAKAIGLTIPESYLLRADEVIE